jgi:hypothetical protein
MSASRNIAAGGALSTIAVAGESNVKWQEKPMAAVDPARDKVASMLHDAVARLHEDIERVEFWTEVLGCLARPVPDYTLENSKLNHFNLPGREGRTGHSDFTKGDETASISRLGKAANRDRKRG